jgi:hypothetical protein
MMVKFTNRTQWHFQSGWPRDTSNARRRTNLGAVILPSQNNPNHPNHPPPRPTPAPNPRAKPPGEITVQGESSGGRCRYRYCTGTGTGTEYICMCPLLVQVHIRSTGQYRLRMPYFVLYLRTADFRGMVANTPYEVHVHSYGTVVTGGTCTVQVEWAKYKETGVPPNLVSVFSPLIGDILPILPPILILPPHLAFLFCIRHSCFTTFKHLQVTHFLSAVYPCESVCSQSLPNDQYSLLSIASLYPEVIHRRYW